MVFSSQTFLFLFLPAVFCGVLIKNRAVQNVFLLIASLLFYSWGESKTVVLMCGVTFVAYIAGMIQQKTRSARIKKAVFIVSLILIIGNLVVFKYLGFFTRNLSFLGIPETKISLPIGISFYTFQILSYVIDLYKGKVRLQKNFFYLLMYVCFFPQLIAGPIVRYDTVEREILERTINTDMLVKGLRRFCIGLGKKLLIANQVAKVSAIIYSGDPSSYGTFMYWIAAVAFALQIYYDFSGYSDMAIGLGLMFGFHFLENFNYPYIALSVTDFWRRWHISLSTWFRDYVYIELGGNRVSKPRWIFNILFVWLLTGFWHGADWNFIIWGLYYGVLLIIEKLFIGKLLSRIPRVFCRLYTIIIVLCGWVIFNVTDLEQMGAVFKTMFVFRGAPLAASLLEDVSIVTGLLFVLIGIVFCIPFFKKIKLGDGAFAALAKNSFCLMLFVLSVAFSVSESFNPFIYFRF